jgi:hypothetical protein
MGRAALTNNDTDVRYRLRMVVVSGTYAVFGRL